MNIFFKSLTCVALGGALLGVSGCGGGGGGVDPNPPAFAPTTLSGQLNSNSFYNSDTDRYYDIYVCDALDSGSARVAMASNDFDTQLYIYQKGSDGVYRLVSSNDDADSSTTNSDDIFDVTQGRTYRILATSARANETGNYAIRFSDDLSQPAFVTTAAVLRQSALKAAVPSTLPPAGKAKK